jgi:hypothetical protein
MEVSKVNKIDMDDFFLYYKNFKMWNLISVGMFK